MFWYNTIDEIAAVPLQKEVLARVQKLTAYLKQHAQDYRLELIAEDWSHDQGYRDLCQSYGWEGIGARFWLREIAHHDAELALVYAQVFVPVETYNAFSEVFEKLATQSIGEVLLFQQQDLQRSGFKFATLTASSPWYAKAARVLLLGNKDSIHVRASLFTLAKSYPLFIVEYFNPNFKMTESLL